MFYFNAETNSEARYSLSKFVEFSENGGFDTPTSYLLQEIQNLSVFGKRQVLTEVGRPDLLSYNIYETTQLWWLLLLYNNKIDFQDLVEGEVLIYPSLRSIEELYFRLKSLDTVSRRT